MDVKTAIADILKQERIEYVFGYTGGHICHMFEAADQAGIKIILNRQEGNAAYMADGYARCTDKPSILLGTSGPGVTNMVTGVATAFMDSIPLIVIGAAVPTFSWGRNAVQDTSGLGRTQHQKDIFQSITKASISVIDPIAVPNVVREAFKLALSGRPGPVFIEIPSDWWKVEIPYVPLTPNQYRNGHLPLCQEGDCRLIEEQFFTSKHPVVIIGEGANESGISDQLMKFINTVKVPFSVAPCAKSIVEEHHPLYLGAMRASGKTQKVYEYMRSSDFLLFLGDRMQQSEVGWLYNNPIFQKAILAQVDYDETEIGRVYPIQYSAIGSISSFIRVFSHKNHPNAKMLQEEVSALKKKYPVKNNYQDGIGVHPLALNSIVEELAREDAIIVADTGYAKSMAITKFLTKRTQQFLVADKNGPMGWSVPAALGAALATKKEVICFTGDGGFQMSLNELGTAMQYGVKVIYIVENNKGCRLITDVHTSYYGHQVATLFDNPDFEQIAKGYKIQGITVNTQQELRKSILQAQKYDKSSVINVHLDQDLMVWE